MRRNGSLILRIAAWLIAAVVTAGAVSGCGVGGYEPAELDRAEVLMQQYPDSALHLLESVDNTKSLSERGRARYAVLLSQAYDKNYIDVTNDSLISIATDYFSERSDDRRYDMLSHYYHARV